MRYGRDALANIPRTVHGGQAWKMGDIEDYSHNLNPFGPPECLAEILRASADGTGHYPDDNCTELKAEISRTLSLKEQNIVIGAGSSEIIRNFPNAFLERGDRAMICDPSFAEYSQQCRVAGAETVYSRLTEEEDFRMNTRDIASAKNIKALYICNPNNPTGRIEPRDKILETVRECGDRGILVFLDETLLDLVKGHENISCMKYASEYDNLIVAGSLTKSFAIPGIRVGYCVSSPHLAEEINKVRITWNVGYIEQNAARLLLSEHTDHVSRAASLMAEESRYMHSELEKMGFPVGKISDSFFCFCSLKELGIKGSEFQRRMLRDRIMVRDCASFGRRFEYYIRFSVKDRERNDMFLRAAENSMKHDG
ncbi:MAG: histidinol-phosphate aminotransferase family protein [Candidatus Methanoplasma sp.]|jgi:threonine-phosphate decarboxylase|nr:histidinol-phosphate aminotransferase family protein [Candidatus Methanoplasma sp.]